MATAEIPAHIRESDRLGPPVSPWSCFPCRRRKIRCDRRYPCSHCSKGDIECGFPISGRTPTRRHDLPSFTSKKEKHDDLLGRLRRLEGFVAKLGAETEEGNQTMQTSAYGNTRALNSETMSPNVGGIRGHAAMIVGLDHVTRELGTLVTHDNESIYVGNWLWGVICDEVKHIRQAVEESGLEPEPLEKKILSPSIQGVPFFWGSTDNNSGNLQPLPSQVPYIWEIFVENVDPFVKILHIPTLSKAMKEAKGKFNSMSRGMEALMFAVSLAAVNSLREDEIEENFGEDKQTLVTRLRLGTEQALSRAGILNTTDISTVQAFVIYLEIVQQSDGQRATWALIGLLVRIAAGMGLHRDGSHFPNVSPFEAEMRRRVWYHICLLDGRVGDCQVANIGITESLFDTKQPANLNDGDITPEMPSLPAPKNEYTDATFFVLRCKMWHFGREFRLLMAPEPASIGANTASQLELLLKMKKCMAKDLEQYLGARKSPLDLLLRTVIAIDVTRFDHVIHVANNFKSPHGEDESRKAFALAIASLGHIFQFAESQSAAQWRWYLHGCIQWHTMSTILVRLSTSPWGPVSEVAWVLAKKAFVHLSEATSRDPMRQPLPELMNSVAARREIQIRKMREASTWAEKVAQMGTVLVSVPPLRDFSDGREAFDTRLTEERFSLEIDVSDGLTQGPNIMKLNSSQTLSGSEGTGLRLNLAPSVIGTDESSDASQYAQDVYIVDGATALERPSTLSSVGTSSEDFLHDPELWSQSVYSYAIGNDEEIGWLA